MFVPRSTTPPGRARAQISKIERVWRGVTGGGVLPRSFLEPNAYGICGGVEFAPGGCSSAEQVAVKWAAAGNDTSFVFEIKVGVDRPANTAWLTDYPALEELTLPAFTFFEVQGTRVKRDFTTSDGHFQKGSVMYIDIAPQFGTL